MLIPSAPVEHIPGLVVNGRFRSQRVTGVQRYAHEIVNRLPMDAQILTPRNGRGAVGHFWEQTALPVACHGRLLWSPNASGPVSYPNQIVTFHDLFPVENPEWYSASYARWYGIVMRRLAQNAMSLIAVSEYTKQRLVKVLGRSPDDITVIYNGSHMSGVATEEQIGSAAAALNLPSRRYVLSLSSIEPRKNLRGLLKAWEAVHALLPDDVWLVLAGPKASEAVYRRQELPNHLPRVFYTDYVAEEHLPGLYTGASLFVFPSFAEGFGLPLLEAMACGRRCIAASTSSLPEVGGEAALYVNPHNPEEIARALLHCLVQQPIEHGPYQPSLEQAQRFSWDRAAAQTTHVIQAALERSPDLTGMVAGRTSAQ